MTAQSATAHFRGLSDEARVEHWQAWRMGEQSSYPIELYEPDTLAQALARAVARGAWKPGDTLAVLHTHEGKNERRLWLYTLKRSTKIGSYHPSTSGGRSVFVGRMEPKLLLETAVQSFAPVEPFDAFRDDPRGIDLSLVNQ